MTDLLLRTNKDSVATLTLNSPGSLNALSDAMLAELSAALTDIAEDTSVKAVLLKGAGRAFCAGHDLKEMQAARDGAADGGQAYYRDLFDRCAQMMMQIVRLPKPVIALPHGIATAAGCQLVATCDLAIAAEDTRFGVNGINIGLFCSTPMVALSRNIPRKKVVEMLMTGEFMSAADAERFGLVNRVVPAEDLVAEGEALAATLASKIGPVLTIGKEAFYAQAEMSLGAAYEYTAEVMTENLMLEETRSGIDAFLSKSKNGKADP